MKAATAHTRHRALIAGPLIAALVYYLLPETYVMIDGTVTAVTSPMKATVAVIAWMAIWWFTETVDIAVTALLPLILFPLLGIGDIKTVASSYASPLIFLFVGGFIIGLSIHRWGLDKRIALLVLLAVGQRPAHVVAGFMLVTAFLSAFISNTATTIMLLPIALSVVALHDASPDDAVRSEKFTVCLVIAIAYAASIGGISTVIGTAPNAFTVGFMQDAVPEAFRTEISFVGWMKMALPVSLTLLPVSWLLLTHVIFPLGDKPFGAGRERLNEHYRKLGEVGRGGWVTLCVFALAATLWITRPLISDIEIEIANSVYTPFVGMSDAGIAVLAAMLLFVLPVGNGRRAMDWPTAVKLPWGILLLLGGGFALAAAVRANEVDQLLGAQVVAFAELPDFVVLALVVTVVVFLTEFASNTATTAALVPVFAAFAPVFGIHPLLLVMSATFAASCAFMMPVATPPNAIVFGSGHLRISQMVKAGFWINLAAIMLVTFVGYFWIG